MQVPFRQFIIDFKTKDDCVEGTIRRKTPTGNFKLARLGKVSMCYHPIFKAPELKLSPAQVKQDVIWVSELSVFHQRSAKDSKRVSAAEKKQLKGIGEFMFCQALQYLKQETAATDTTLLLLEASGFYCRTNPYEKASLPELETVLKQKGFTLEAWIKDQTADSGGEFESPEELLEELRKDLCESHAVDLLAQYYTRFGFSPLPYTEPELLSIPMMTTVGKALAYCQSR